MYNFFISVIFPESIEPISFSIDPIGNTAYILHPHMPSFQQDLHIFDIRINGELGLPLSTFIFDLEQTVDPLYDSLRTRSAFEFIKGDYVFRDLGVKLESLTLNGGIITGFAHTRSYSGINAFFGEGSLMENYLLNYKNKLKNSRFSITAAYHNEDMKLPMSNIDFMAKVNESYFLGANSSYSVGGLVDLDYSVDLQVSESQINDDIYEDWIYTQKGSIRYTEIRDLVTFLKWSENENNLNIYRLGIDWSDSLNNLSFSLVDLNDLIIEFLYIRNFGCIYTKLERKILDEFSDKTDHYVLNALSFGFIKDSFNLTIEPSSVALNSSTFHSYGLNGSYANDNFSLNSLGKIYENNEWGLEYIINSSMQIQFPYFERYTPYLRAQLISRKADYSNTIALDESMIEYHLNGINRLTNIVNLEVGFNLKSFKVSYHFNNILAEEGRAVKNYENVPIHKYLKIKWKFND